MLKTKNLAASEEKNVMLQSELISMKMKSDILEKEGKNAKSDFTP